MYRMDAVFLILLVSDVLKIPKIKVEAHFLKKLNFVTNKCLTRDAFEKCPRTTENLSKFTALQLSQYIVMCTDFLIIAYTLDFFYKQLRILSRTPRPKLVLELLNWLLKFFLCHPEVRLKQ